MPWNNATNIPNVDAKWNYVLPSKTEGGLDVSLWNPFSSYIFKILATDLQFTNILIGIYYREKKVGAW